MRRLAAALLFVAALALPASAYATFPGANGKIAFVRGGDIWTMNPDGTGQVNLTSSAATEVDPAWSPDGTKIAFGGPQTQPNGGRQIYVMNADGTNVTHVGNGFTPDREPAWSPDGAEIAFLIGGFEIWAMPPDNSSRRFVGRTSPPSSRSFLEELEWSPAGDVIAFRFNCLPDSLGSLVGKVASAGGALQPVTSPTLCDGQTDLPYDDFGPSWSPDAQRILFFRESIFGSDPDPTGTYTIKPDGTGKAMLGPVFGSHPAWSPDGAEIAFVSGSRIKTMNANGTGVNDITDGADPDWQPIPINAYPRPKGASPMTVSLVPAYEPCTSANGTHGAPLAFGSCSPAQLASDYLTTGTPDANGRAVRMVASLTAKVITGDVRFTTHLNDVANKDLSDYTGSLHANLPVRITDKLNTPSPGGPGAATTQPFAYGFDIPCATDPDPLVGSDCSLTTTANTLVPGTVQDNLRAVWQLGQVRVFDGGPDADGSTPSGNTVFAVQGVFVP